LPGVRLRRVVIGAGKLDCPNKPAVYSNNKSPIFGHLRCRPPRHSLLPGSCAFLSAAKSAPESPRNQQNNSKSNGLLTKRAYLRTRLPNPPKHIIVSNE